MNILERVYKTRSNFDELFRTALAEQESAGAISPETEALIERAKTDREAVISDLCSWFLREQAKLRGLRAIYDPIREEMEREEREHRKTMEFIESQIFRILPPSPEAQIANEQAYVYYRESERLEILNASELPSDLVEPVLSVKPKTDEIKKALKVGQAVPGAVLHRNFSPQIKPGGAAAIKNARARLSRVIAREETPALVVESHEFEP